MTRPSEYFRAGVGVIVTNADGMVLAMERADVPGAWQFPQGGLEASETPAQAAFRELREETGLQESSVKIVKPYPEPLVYELPPEARSRKTGRGQVQYWFLARYLGHDSEIRLPSGGEFRHWKWVRFEQVLEGVVAFRRPLYERLAARFLPQLIAD